MESINKIINPGLQDECNKCANIINAFAKPEDAKLQELASASAAYRRSSKSQKTLLRAPETLGSGIGWQIGAEKTDYVIILNTQAAVDAFFSPNVTLGGNLSVAAGPYGRSAEAAVEPTSKFAAIYSYSNSQGLFAGMSLEGSVILERKDANEQFYKEKVTAKELLSGFVPKPSGAEVLYTALNKH
ncbi:SH3 domain-containing YSC84-like protein 1 [Kappamyces sp. JEL0680]|nr:SH3 domain-containing YSC84-like protein 1 [Kappamyces sp. JEL0680]